MRRASFAIDEVRKSDFPDYRTISPLPMTFSISWSVGNALCTVIDTPWFAAPLALQFMPNIDAMRRSIFFESRGGRPVTGHDPMVGLRLSQESRAAVKKWASSQPDKPNFSEAVRRLIDIGLKSLDEFE
jgi:hypothetical protein